MMGKPPDIPQDIWAAALLCQREIEAQHVNIETIARAIMLERERIASAAERQEWNGHGTNNYGLSFARSIRRGEI